MSIYHNEIIDGTPFGLMNPILIGIFVSGQIPINPGTSVIFNMMFGPNIGYGGNQFEYDSSKNYNFRVNENFGTIEIPLKIE